MKIFFTILALILSLTSFAVTYTSKNNKKQTWENNSTWIKSPNQNWVADNPGTALNWDALYVYGYTIRTGNLTVQGATDVHIYDTLVVSGNLNLIQGGKITIEDGGVLVVLGNLYLEGGVQLKNNGTGRVGVVGEFTHTNGTITVDTNDQFYLFDTSPTFSGGAYVNGTQYTSYPPPNGNTAVLSSKLSTEQNLKDEDMPFYNFIMGLCPPLPIKLIEFSISVVNNKSVLKWITSNEINNDYFTIQHSKDGKTFEDIGIIDGAGNSNKNISYSWTDEYNIEGVNYYRLSQTDFDGTIVYFKIIYVNLKWYYIKGFKINDDEKLISVNQFDISGRIVNDDYKGIKILIIVTNKQKYCYKLIE